MTFPVDVVAFLSHDDGVADFFSEASASSANAAGSKRKELNRSFPPGLSAVLHRDNAGTKHHGREIVDRLPDDDAIVSLAIVCSSMAVQMKFSAGRDGSLPRATRNISGETSTSTRSLKPRWSSCRLTSPVPAARSSTATLRGERISDHVNEAIALQEAAIGKVVELGSPAAKLFCSRMRHQFREIAEEQDDPMVLLVDQPLA